MRSSSAFTLIELLVVVTIIVVLLALLTPALDKAIYQAELAVCGAKLHSIGSGAVVYAMGNKRRYPYRPGVEANVTWPTALIYNGNQSLDAVFNYPWVGSNPNSLNIYDDRTVLRTFLSLNAALNDPLSGKLDFEAIDADAHAYVSYNLFFGFRYLGQQGMMKMGDKLGWSAGNVDWHGELLASDRDANRLTGMPQCAHPDYDGVTTNLVLQNGTFQNNQDSNLPFKMTISTWISDAPRGPTDLNFAYQDGSVRRENHLKPRDPRMAYIPESNTNAGGVAFQTVPTE